MEFYHHSMQARILPNLAIGIPLLITTLTHAGCAILYTVNCDSVDLNPPTQITGNIILMVALRFPNEDVVTNTMAKGIIVATTYLFWRPMSYYERVRQASVLLRRMVKFRKEVAQAEEKEFQHHSDRSKLPMPNASPAKFLPMCLARMVDAGVSTLGSQHDLPARGPGPAR
ncbi:hypothetical protein BC938DRAFT_482146 [Jimgerdemannia flammicorona]|nr:hypothetical protein BC938DRAFT_482146 [Jimgerdemannia flammicorona]